MLAPPLDSPSQLKVPFIVFAIAATLLVGFVFANGLSDLPTSSEAREVLVARTLSEGGNWMVPTRDQMIASKPPLHHWIVAGVSLGTGIPVSGWLHRTVSSFFAFLVLLLVGATPFVLSLRRNLAMKRSVLSMLILAICPGFLRLASDARVDMVFAFFILSSLIPIFLLALRVEDVKEVRNQSLILPLLLMSAACLTKGPLGIALPIVAIVGALIARFGFLNSLLIVFTPRWSWLFLFVLGPAWYLYGAYAGGLPFLERHLFENVERIVGGEYVNSGPAWFYVRSWATSAFPWIYVALYLGILGKIFSDRRLTSGSGNFELAIAFEKMTLGACFAGTLFLSIASGKRHSYILPLLPLFSLYISFRLCDWFETSSAGWVFKAESWARRIKVTLIGGSALFFVVLLGGIVGWRGDNALVSHFVHYVNSHLVMLTLTLVFVAISLGVNREKPFSSYFVVKVAISLILFIVLLNGFGRGMKAELKGYRRFAESVQKIVPYGDPLVIQKGLHDERYDVLMYYLNRPISILPLGAPERRCYPYELAYGPSGVRTLRGGASIVQHQTLSESRGKPSKALHLIHRSLEDRC